MHSNIVVVVEGGVVQGVLVSNKLPPCQVAVVDWDSDRDDPDIGIFLPGSTEDDLDADIRTRIAASEIEDNLNEAPGGPQ